MSSIEGDRLGESQGELLRGQELYTREREAWKRVLGVEVEVKPLPADVTPEVQQKLVGMGFGLRYIPALDLGSREDLARMGAKDYLTHLWVRYQRWERQESLDNPEYLDVNVSRNLSEKYWEEVKNGNIDFPVLPGRWLAVETVEKPRSDVKKYPPIPVAEKLGLPAERINISLTAVDRAIEREKHSILSEVGLSDRPVRLLEAVEWNLLGNREGWARTHTDEGTNTEWREGNQFRRLVIGYSSAGNVDIVDPDKPYSDVGFRVAIVLGAGRSEQK